MIIQQKRIRNLCRHLPKILEGQSLRFGVANVDKRTDLAERAGLPAPPVPVPGQRVLPSRVGPATRYNAEGKQRVRRDLPMETAYRLVEWHWKEWHGTHKVDRSDFKDVPYRRYPRELIPPPSLELEIVSNSQNRLLLITDPMPYAGAPDAAVLNAINVCLELFGECEVFTSELQTTAPPAVTSLNWEVLPPGPYPWARIKQEVKQIIDGAKEGNKSALMMRLETVNSYEPAFVAIGTAGFYGYVIYGFPDKSLFILESAYYGNATYVFDKDWQTLSQLTKADILSQSLQTARLIHRNDWEHELAALFK